MSVSLIQVNLRLNRTNIQLLRGFAHDNDRLQDAFMHKTSVPKFSIPYNEPRYQPMPNVFSFTLKPSTTTEAANPNCKMNIEDEVTMDCFASHLQDVLGCQLPWDVGLDSSNHKSYLLSNILFCRYIITFMVLNICIQTAIDVRYLLS